MNYLLIKIHSFACDYPGCVTTEESDEWHKADAAKSLRADGWQIGSYYIRCPEHRGLEIPAGGE